MFDSYTALKAAVQDWLNRDDLEAGQFITLAEAQLGRDVNHWRREKRATATAQERYLELPADFHRAIRLHVKASRDPLQPMSQNEMAARRAADDTVNRPMFYALVGGEIELYPTPPEGTVVEMSYSATIPALSDGAPTNWLLERFPDAYLYGSLIHTGPYLHEDQRAATWASFYQAAIDAIATDNTAARWGGNLRIRSK